MCFPGLGPSSINKPSLYSGLPPSPVHWPVPCDSLGENFTGLSFVWIFQCMKTLLRSKTRQESCERVWYQLLLSLFPH